MPYLAHNNNNIYYETHGSGHPLVLITGLGAEHNFWANVLPILCKDYQVLIMDNRGVGRTQTAPGDLSTKDMASDVAALMQHIGFNKAHIIGHSMGGAIAQHLAIDYPERIDKLVLYATFAKFDQTAVAQLNGMRMLRHSVSDYAQWIRACLPGGFSASFLGNTEQIESLIHAAANNPYKQSAENYCRQLDACFSHDTSEALKQISMPTLVIHAEKDMLLPSYYAERLMEALPNSILYTAPNAPHCFHIEQPQLFCDHVANFMAQH